MLKSKKVNIVEGWVKIESKNVVVVKKENGEEERLASDYILIATGSQTENFTRFRI